MCRASFMKAPLSHRLPACCLTSACSVQKSKGMCTAADLMTVAETERAVQEAQRMYSVAPLVVRKALQDVRVGQYTIPAGTAMILHVFAMHNTSANYERHTEFLPVGLINPVPCIHVL